MSIQNPMAINLGESFDHFPCAPIMEAVIDIRARVTEAFEESTVRPQRYYINAVAPRLAKHN